MLEAMAIGTPVAAFPVDGLLEVVSLPDSRYWGWGGVLCADRQAAGYQALRAPRLDARRTMSFSWVHAAQLFKGFFSGAQLRWRAEGCEHTPNRCKRQHGTRCHTPVTKSVNALFRLTGTRKMRAIRAATCAAVYPRILSSAT